MDSRDEQWAALYDALLKLLSASGKDDPFGKGDFWLLDDDWGDMPMQKVCVFRPEFLTRDLVAHVQALLRSGFADWGVIFDLSDMQEPRIEGARGIIVYQDRIEEDWDKDDLRSRLGDRFRF
jgi:hypothetical protein